MSGCPGCLPEGRELAALYNTKCKEATDLSKDKGFAVAVYRTLEGFEIIKADIAQAEGYLIKEIIQYLQ